MNIYFIGANDTHEQISGAEVVLAQISCGAN